MPKVRKKYNFICGDIIKISKNGKNLKSLFNPDSENIKFDLIILINTLHHFGTSNQVSVLKYLWKYLEPGGALLIKTCDDGLRAIHPDPDKNAENLLDLCDISGTSDRYNGRKLNCLLNELPQETVEKIEIEYFMYDTTGMNETQALNFLAYDNAFRLDTLMRAHQEKNDSKTLNRLNKAKIIYEDMKQNISDLFQEKKLSML